MTDPFLYNSEPHRRRRWQNSPLALTKGSSDHDILSTRGYLFAITAFTVLGLVSATLTSAISLPWSWAGNTWLGAGLAVGSVATYFFGMWIYRTCRSAVVSIMGYVLGCSSFGLFIGPTLYIDLHVSLVRVLIVATAITVGYGLLSAALDMFGHWSSWLLGCLITLLMGCSLSVLHWLFGVTIGGAGGLNIWEWIGVILFALRLLHDVNRTMQRTYRTVHSALRHPALLIVDLFDVYLRLLIKHS